MIKRLVKHGNSLALLIDKPILDLLGIDAETAISMTTNGRSLVISPAQDPEDDARFRAALDRGIKQYGDMLKRLADK